MDTSSVRYLSYICMWKFFFVFKCIAAQLGFAARVCTVSSRVSLSDLRAVSRCLECLGESRSRGVSLVSLPIFQTLCEIRAALTLVHTMLYGPICNSLSSCPHPLHLWVYSAGVV